MELRDYGDLLRRVDDLNNSGLRVETVGEVDRLPVHVIHATGNEACRRRVLLTGGVHGDEPAGVEAVLAFLEGRRQDSYPDDSFCVMPCVNPTGYVRNTRENGDGVDINRSFDADGIAEVNILRGVLEGHSFDVFMDCHEDWEAAGFYMYEGSRAGVSRGTEVIEQVSGVGPIDPHDNDDESPVSPGVYAVAESWGTRGLAPYVLLKHAPSVFIFETPTDWDLERRVQAHLTALDTILGGDVTSRH